MKWHDQCDQIGRFFKVLGNKFYLKSSPNIRWLCGLFWQIILFKLKLPRPLFGQHLKNFGQILLPSSGHNGHNWKARLFWPLICYDFLVMEHFSKVLHGWDHTLESLKPMIGLSFAPKWQRLWLIGEATNFLFYTLVPPLGNS